MRSDYELSNFKQFLLLLHRFLAISLVPLHAMTSPKQPGLQRHFQAAPNCTQQSIAESQYHKYDNKLVNKNLTSGQKNAIAKAIAVDSAANTI